MSTWVQAVPPANIDLETIAANRNTIKVNDVHNAGQPLVAKVALHAINTGNNADDRALKVQGKSEFTTAGVLLNNVPLDTATLAQWLNIGPDNADVV
jgi:hypothetical protein